MVKHRIFIAINIPNGIKQKLLDVKAYWQDLPARWTKPENIHITLVFIGYVTADELKNIDRIVTEVSERHIAFELKLTKILLGPPRRPPRMVWAEIEKNPELLELQRDLENALYETPDTGYRKKENRPWSPHITLSRFDPREFQGEGYDRNETIDLKLSFPVRSIEIMGSVLKRTGAEYEIVQSISLLHAKQIKK